MYDNGLLWRQCDAPAKKATQNARVGARARVRKTASNAAPVNLFANRLDNLFAF
jgi:hypothetical protein